MVPRVGQRIGPYEILGRLGSGGMGLVYSAWDVRLQRDVAIKLLREEFLTPGMRSRFLQEARAASRLNHPNICTIFDIGEQQGDPYLVMELLKGETVRQRITHGPVAPLDVLCVAREVADALTVAHAQNVIHRDIKPANIILVDKDGGGFQSKVLDFGLAKMDSGISGDSRDLTATGTTVGTVSYMSPEQARGEVIDPRSDLFSLGVVLYEMATGQLPFVGATSALIFVQLLSHRPEPVREFNSEIPKDFERIVSKLLEKSRGDRFQTARELVHALHRITARRPSAVRSLWNQPLLRRHRNLAPALPESEADGDPISQTPHSADLTPTASTSSDEAFLRPVKRIVSGDWKRLPKHPSAEPGAATQAGRTEAATPAKGQEPASVTAIAVPPIEAAASPPPLPRIAIDRMSDRREPGSPVPKSKVFADGASSDELPFHLSTQMSRRPVRTFEREELDEEGAPMAEPNPEAPTGKAVWIVAAMGVLVLAAAGVLGWFFWWRPVSTPPAQRTALLLGFITNRTGDNTLSGILIAGLRFDLEQSPEFSVRGNGDFAVGLKQIGAADNAEPSMDDARRVAQAAGASTVVLGDIQSDGATYTLSLQAYAASTGVRLAEASETASSREQIAAAIDRLASDLRSGLGESGDSIARASVPLSREATSNLDALQAYVNGDVLASQGRMFDALQAYDRAAVTEPHFTQAYLRLSEIYRLEHAEVAAAKAALRAQNASSTAGSRLHLLAQASAATNASGDYPHAIDLLQQITHAYPDDVEANLQIAVTQRLEGKYSESLETAEKVLKLEPSQAGAAGDAELAMIGLDRNEAAEEMEEESKKAGRPHEGIEVLLGFLSSEAGEFWSPDPQTERLAPQEFAASVLDAQGEMTTGLAQWQAIAERAQAAPELASAASYALSHAALDRALAEDCPAALALVRQAFTMPAGPDAAHAMGTAAGLCGDIADAKAALITLDAESPDAFVVRRIYIPELKALLQWKSDNNPEGALSTLELTRQNDLLSLSPFLQGLIQLSIKQPELANVSFQEALLHRGAASLVDAESFPIAQLNLARAYLAYGDNANSTAAYARFLALWAGADASSPLLTEARAHSR